LVCCGLLCPKQPWANAGRFAVANTLSSGGRLWDRLLGPGGHFGQPHSGYTPRALDPPASSSAARSSPASRGVEAVPVQGDGGRVVCGARGGIAPAGEPWRGPRSISQSSGQVPQQWEFEQPFPVRQARHARHARHNGRRPARADRDASAGRPDRVASDPGPRRERQQR
jgi:hypothetical protein